MARIPDLESKLADAQEAASGAMLREEVTSEDIASVVSRWTGIPVDKMMEGEREKLLKMEAVARQARHRAEGCGRRPFQRRCAVAAPACRIRTGPLGSFLFLGPTGVGKTELTKALAGNICSTTTMRWCAST
jgi:ATP-dependent Clp protease ATP-binding subunit ClpB